MSGRSSTAMSAPSGASTSRSSGGRSTRPAGSRASARPSATSSSCRTPSPNGAPGRWSRSGRSSSGAYRGRCGSGPCRASRPVRRRPEEAEILRPSRADERTDRRRPQNSAQLRCSTRPTAPCAKRVRYASCTARREATASGVGSVTIRTMRAASWTIRPSGPRHWPRPAKTVSPSGKRGVIRSARNRSKARPETRPPSGRDRPNSSCALSVGRAPSQSGSARAGPADPTPSRPASRILPISGGRAA